jgi:hypothetical protein
MLLALQLTALVEVLHETLVAPQLALVTTMLLANLVLGEQILAVAEVAVDKVPMGLTTHKLATVVLVL